MNKPTRIKGKVERPDPLEPTETTPAEMAAIRALTEGKATEHQQGLVVGWIARATDVTGLEIRLDSERASCVAGGKRFIGLQFFQLAKAILAK